MSEQQLEDKKRYELLLLTYWGTKDIMSYIKCGSKKARKLKSELIDFYGTDAICPYNQYLIDSNLFLIHFLKKTRKEEIEVFK